MNDLEKQNIEMKKILRRFCKICDKTVPWESSIDTLAGASRIFDEQSKGFTESTALNEIAHKLQDLANLRRDIIGISVNMEERKMKYTKRLKDLPERYTIPDACELCGASMAYTRPSAFHWVVDGDEAYGFCSNSCAREFMWSKDAQRIVVKRRMTGGVS